MAHKQIGLLRPEDLNCNIFSVYDYDGCSLQELLCHFFTKINECIEVSQNSSDLVEWLKNEGLEENVVKTLEEWLRNGKLADIISNKVLKDITDKLKRMDTCTINVTCPPAGLEPCVMDGHVDNTVALQKINDWIVANCQRGTIYIPHGDLVIEDTVKINALRVRLDCDGQIVAKMANKKGKYALRYTVEGTGDYYSKYYNMTMKNRIQLVGELNGAGCNGLWVGTKQDEGNLGPSRVSFENCIIHMFDEGIKLEGQTYLNNFNNCSIYECNLALVIKHNHDDGENNNFSGCAIFNSKVAVTIDNENSTTFFDRCSFDYNMQAILKLVKGQVFFNNCHFEHDEAQFEGKVPFVVDGHSGNNVLISDSFIMFKNGHEGKKTYLVENNNVTNPYGGFTIKDCFLQGMTTKSGYLFNGGGINKIEGSRSKDWDNWKVNTDGKLNLVSDFHNTIPLNQKIDIKKMSGNDEHGSAWLQMLHGVDYRGLQIQKKGPVANPYSWAFVVERRQFSSLIDCNYYIRAVSSTNKTDYDVTIGTCDIAPDGTFVNITKERTMGEMSVNNNGRLEWANVAEHGHQIRLGDARAKYIFLEFQLYNAHPDTSLLINDVIITEF